MASALGPALAAIALVVAGHLLGWRGVDLPAQLHRVAEERAQGWVLWDPSWFGGYWTAGYSVAYPALAAAAGVAVLAAVSAGAATLAVPRLLRLTARPAGAVAGAAVFAVGTAAQSAIGQLPFLTGEAFGACACWAAARRRWWLAALLAAASSCTSPLSGAFVALAMAAWLLSRHRAARLLTRTPPLPRPVASRRTPQRGVARRPAVGPAPATAPATAAVGVLVAAALPVAVTAGLFPGQGPMPYPVIDFAWEIVVAAGLWLVSGASRPAIRTAAVLFALVATAAVAVPNPLGGNVGRIEDALALPLAVAVLWTDRRPVLLAALTIPLALSGWQPAWAAVTDYPARPYTHRAYFEPLLSALARAGAAGPGARVEVVPTATHWESYYVAGAVPLARGWDRQLDAGDDPLFYAGRGGASRVTPARYRAWLGAWGIRFVALPDAPLDLAGRAEASVIRRGVPGLSLVWRTAHWRLYEVAGRPGVVSGPGRLVAADGRTVTVEVERPGPLLVREHYEPGWHIGSGAGCVSEAPGGWILLDADRPGRITLRLGLSMPLTGGGRACRVGRQKAPADGRAGRAVRGPS